MVDTGDLIITNKFRVFVVKGSRLDKNGNTIFDTMTIEKHPQQRVVEGKDVRFVHKADALNGGVYYK